MIFPRYFNPYIVGFCLFGGNALLPSQKCPPISFDKIYFFKMPFLKGIFTKSILPRNIEGHFTFALLKCPPILLEKMLLFIMLFLKRAFWIEAFIKVYRGAFFQEQMEVDFPTTAGADQMTKPKKCYQVGIRIKNFNKIKMKWNGI